MTRKEEIEQASFSATGNIKHEEWFIKGAEWADEHPNEQMIAKYLFEKKGYPVDLNGNLPSFEDTMKAVESYNKYTKKQWLDKAYEWLEPVFKNYAGYNCGMDLVKDFKKAMEE